MNIKGIILYGYFIRWKATYILLKINQTITIQQNHSTRSKTDISQFYRIFYLIY